MSLLRKGSPSRPAASASPQQTTRPQYGLLGLALLGAGWLYVQLPPTQGLLLLLGIGLGFSLFHTRFGFSSAFRQLLSVGQGRALQAHMLLLGVTATCLPFFLPWGRDWAASP